MCLVGVCSKTVLVIGLLFVLLLGFFACFPDCFFMFVCCFVSLPICLLACLCVCLRLCLFSLLCLFLVGLLYEC